MIDEVFGTHLASQLPSKKEGKRSGVINFAPASSNESGNAAGVGHGGWFLTVEYNYNGNIENYYLTNIHM
jgi:hypothetical protein